MRYENISSLRVRCARVHCNDLQPALPILKNENESEIGPSNSNADRTLKTASVHNQRTPILDVALSDLQIAIAPGAGNSVTASTGVNLHGRITSFNGNLAFIHRDSRDGQNNQLNPTAPALEQM